MKPITNLEKTVFSLKSKLKPLSPSQKDWGFSNLFEPKSTLNKNTFTCLECNHKWKDLPGVVLLAKIEKSCQCPNCNKNVTIIETAKRTIRRTAYFSILTTKNNFQIIRYFFLTKTYFLKSEPQLHYHEVMQHWIDQKGKITYVSKKCTPSWEYCDRWINYSELEIIRPQSQAALYRNQIQPDLIYPRISLTPQLKRNGFTGNSYEKTPSEFISQVIKNPKIETLLKVKRVDFIEKLSESTINHNWPQIKIATKHKYFPSNYTDWIDQIALLKHFNKDILSTKYICPENLHLEHKRLVDKKIAQQKQLEQEKLRKNILALNEKYIQAKKKYFDINFSDHMIEVKVLTHVNEFYRESEKLIHCLFSNKYFEKENSLILSARINDEPIETIELSLQNFKIIQSRGLENKPTKYHNQIIELVNSNIKQIKKIHFKKEFA